MRTLLSCFSTPVNMGLASGARKVSPLQQSRIVDLKEITFSWSLRICNACPSFVKSLAINQKRLAVVKL
jgi:hypothetical protein